MPAGSVGMIGILFITFGFWTLVLWKMGNAYYGFRDYRRRAQSTGFPVIESPQITARKNDFVKPVRNYKVMDIFGRSILTTEGEEWRRHKRIVGKSFGERSMGLVWGESVRQTMGMVGVWGRRNGGGGEVGGEGGDGGGLRVADAGNDTAILSLHVICAAGFGVRELWEEEESADGGEKEGNGNGNGTPDLGLNRPVGDHTMGFKDCLNSVLSSLILIILWPQWVLKYSPIKHHREVYKALRETTQYLTELLEHKKKQMAAGEHDKVTMDLMGNMLKASSESPIDIDIDNETQHTTSDPLTETEIKSNAFIFLLAGHETTASSIHLCFIYLALSLSSQYSMQHDIDSIVGSKPPHEWTYMRDFSRLYNSMVGAVLNEELRLMPVAETIPKVAVGDQWVVVDGKEMLVPGGCFVHLNTVGVNRNPRYWPHEVVEGGGTDLDGFVPERWVVAKGEERNVDEGDGEHEKVLGKVITGDEISDSYEDSSSTTLFKPVKGAFLSFSEGPRACPGKKFAQVEITAVLTTIFQKYSVELDVARWASDEEVERMDEEGRRTVYGKAVRETWGVLRRCNQAQIVLKMASEDRVPLRFVERGRGRERFKGCV
ncbi:hypothetical protein SBOR_8833 [Sclerotinia borealis F-4128]|uniref:Cytochrome P450 n=1 Tax=Sclerotinia borealis (strain F-4128) TaxID=1432307 RepID=W9C895_SCLBF|nr:hypothetical protein SBOR_8833 [Sclerotinia borealis F-4128]